MALTVRDLNLATRYESDFQLASETIRRAALGYEGQLQAVSEAFRRAALGNQGQLQAVSEAFRRAALGNQGQLQAVSEALRTVVGEAARSHLQPVAQESILPRQEVPADLIPTQHNQLPIAQLFLHATFTFLVAFLVIAYMEAKLANEPEEALLNLLFARWFWYEVHSEFWHGPE
jgi:hypothetical protein